MGLSENNMNRDIWNNVELKKGHFNLTSTSLCLTLSTLSPWSIDLISQSPPWWTPFTKWTWNDSCLTFLFFKKFLYAHLQLLNLLQNSAVLLVYGRFYIYGRCFTFCGLMEYMHFADDDLNWCVLVICSQISSLGLLKGPQKPYTVLSVGTLAFTIMSFKLFPFLKPIIGIFSKALPCSLSRVKRRWIFNKIFLSFEKIG